MENNRYRSDKNKRHDKSREKRFVNPADNDVRENETDSGIVAGRNAVRELLKSGATIDKILVSGREGSIVALVAEAKEKGIPVVNAEPSKLDYIANGAHHQGIVAYAAQKEYSTVEEILAIAKERGEKPLIVIADGVEDPHNLGALIRCAECAGAHRDLLPLLPRHLPVPFGIWLYAVLQILLRRLKNSRKTGCGPLPQRREVQHTTILISICPVP